MDELTSNLHGQQIYLTHYGDGKATFSDVAKRCTAAGHMAIGVRRGESSQLNLEDGFSVESGDMLITIGEKRLNWG